MFMLSGPVELLLVDSLIAFVTCKEVNLTGVDFRFLVSLSIFLFSLFVL